MMDSDGQHRSEWHTWSVRALATLGILSVFTTCLAFLLDPLEVTWGPLHFTVSKGVKPILITVFLIALGVAIQLWHRPIDYGLSVVFRSRLFKKVVLAVGFVVLFFVTVESVLIAIGFQAELPPMVIKSRVDQGDNSSRYIIPDSELRWKFNPGVMFNGRPVNSMGFLDREVNPIKKDGTIRVICMGDSCTGQGIPPYSGYLHTALTNKPLSNLSWEAFNMGVHGYSSVQGLRLFQLRGKDLNPDVVTLFYGWNDHWLGAKPDSNIMGIQVNSFSGFLFQRLRKYRLFQLMIYGLNPMRKIARTQSAVGYRVPPNEYVWTLRRYIEEIQSVGSVPILMTAPRAQTLTKLLVKNGQSKNLDETMAAHDNYVRLTRQVAIETGSRLVDLAEQFNNPESAELFADDGIHFQRQGRIKIAELLYEELNDVAVKIFSQDE